MTGSIRQHVPFTEKTFHISHLIQCWQREFLGEIGWILVRAEPPCEPLRTAPRRSYEP